MAKNIQHVSFLRNGQLYTGTTAMTAHDEAIAALEAKKDLVNDGEIMLARYVNSAGTIFTIAGIKHEFAGNSGFTFVDLEESAEEIEEKIQEVKQEIINIIGDTFITSANTIEQNLIQLSGDTASTSADTSVEGAKRYAEDLIATLDYEDTLVPGQIVVEVDEAEGVIDVKRAELTSSADSLVITSDANGNINFEANIDNASIVQGVDGKLKVSDSALTQYYGDDKTIEATVDLVNNTKIFSTLLEIKEVSASSATVKEEYALVNASGETIGDTIKIYKDSALYEVYLGHVDDKLTDEDPTTHESPTPDVTSGTGDTALCFIYFQTNGNYKLVAIDIEHFIDEQEFASGVTWNNEAKKVVGVVDPASEQVVVEYNEDGSPKTLADVLTVGADGFKVDNIQDAIDAAVQVGFKELDADESGNTEHITVGVLEVDGKISAVTVSEDNIANADDLDELSAKTITNIKSTNESIEIATANTADGTVEVDVITDASKIKMSGFTADVSGFTGITEDKSISEAIKEVENEFLISEEVTSAALNDLNDRLIALSGSAMSGVSVNGIEVPITDNVAGVSIKSGDAEGSEAIIVDTNSTTGEIKLTIDTLDLGFYDD